MSEDQIERIVERQMDKLDSMLLKGLISQEEYDQEILELDNWSKDQYRFSRLRQYREW